LLLLESTSISDYKLHSIVKGNFYPLLYQQS
jgi:hypothetical protein